jgi:ubiquinone/menaquinone biosynthesis C-methylase UbiE
MNQLDTALPGNAWVFLDPSVEFVREVAPEEHVLIHGYLGLGMVIPPGDGLMDFVDSLVGQPARVGTLYERFDDHELVGRLLESLRGHGFAYVTSEKAPTGEQLEVLRRARERERARSLRGVEVFDLDAWPGTTNFVAAVEEHAIAPEVLLRCARAADHADLLAELAELRQSGRVRIHRTSLHCRDLRTDRALRKALVCLGARVMFEALTWPIPLETVPGLEELTRGCVAVHAVMTPDLSVLEAQVRDQVQAWVEQAFITGLRLRLDADALWPDGTADEDDFVAVFEAVRALEDRLGDVEVVDLPSDDMLLGHAVPREAGGQSGLAGRFRLSYLRWRLPLLKVNEGDNTWTQVPEVEDKLVRPDDDLLPHHPELLGLQPGSVVVDVCGGLGRVARRLSPAVGDEGLVISIEMLRLLSDRAAGFACDLGFRNVQFRTGLAQRIPLPDGTVDAAVNEWTGAIWELGLGPAMIREMARVVRIGGRIAATHRLVQLHAGSLANPWVQYPDIYPWMRKAFAQPGLEIVAERVWGQMVPSLAGERANQWRKQYLPRLVDPFDVAFGDDATPDASVDVYLTVVAQRC